MAIKALPGDLSRSEGRPNLFQKRSQANRIARRSSVTRSRVVQREFVHGRCETRQRNSLRELKRRLRRLTREAAPCEQEQQFAVEPRSKLRIGARQLRRTKLPRQP